MLPLPTALNITSNHHLFYNVLINITQSKEEEGVTSTTAHTKKIGSIYFCKHTFFVCTLARMFGYDGVNGKKVENKIGVIVYRVYYAGARETEWRKRNNLLNTTTTTTTHVC